MSDVVLERFAYIPHMGTFGKLRAAGAWWWCVERPWRDNEPRESCIPCGRYPLARTTYHKGRYETYEVCEVPDRKHIKIHIANTMHDVRGCIGPGMLLGWHHGMLAVLDSRKAFDGFMAAMGGVKESEMHVTNYVGGVGAALATDPFV